MKNESRRMLIKKGLLGVFGLSSLQQVFTSNLTAEEKPLMNINYLIDVLKSTKNPVCEIAATKLLLVKDNKSSYDLHLRNANLDNAEVELIAQAIMTVHSEGGPFLQSFSMSYNSCLGNEGVLSLVEILPSTLTEIGLVQCGIGDESGDALIAWASKAPKLQWLCVENNSFSNTTKEKFIRLGKTRKGFLIVV